MVDCSLTDMEGLEEDKAEIVGIVGPTPPPTFSYPPPPMPAGPRKGGSSLKSTNSSANATSSSEGNKKATISSELSEELSKRLSQIDGKLDFLVSRAKAPERHATQRRSHEPPVRDEKPKHSISSAQSTTIRAAADADRGSILSITMPPAFSSGMKRTRSRDNVDDVTRTNSGTRAWPVDAPAKGTGSRAWTPESVEHVSGAVYSGMHSASPRAVNSADSSPRSPPGPPKSPRARDTLCPDYLPGSRRPSIGSVRSRGIMSARSGRSAATGRSGMTCRRSSSRLMTEGSLIPNLSVRPKVVSRSNSGGSRNLSAAPKEKPGEGRFARSEKRHQSGASRSNEVPGMFKNSLLARRLYERSDSKNIENVQQRVRSLPMAITKRRSKVIDTIYTVLDDPGSSKVAWRTAKIMQFVVVISVLATFVQTIDEPLLKGWTAAAVETVFDIVNVCEVFIRFSCAPNKVNFFSITHTWIDIVAGSALVVRAAGGFLLPQNQDTAIKVILLCFVPIIRFLKILRHFETFNVLINAVRITMEAMPMLLYAVALITMTFASLIYLVEPREIPHSPGQSPFKAFWFCLVTVTTVGYGDTYPNTTVGYAIVMVLIITGVILMAVPIGIIGNTFNQVWNARDYSLLLTKTRNKLHKWGYTAHDIPMLFKLVDNDGNGVLELDEFCELVKEMKIGLSEDRIIALFEHMDKDGSGALDAAEFALEVFPDTFIEAYGHGGLDESNRGSGEGEGLTSQAIKDQGMTSMNSGERVSAIARHSIATGHSLSSSNSLSTDESPEADLPSPQDIVRAKISIRTTSRTMDWTGEQPQEIERPGAANQ